LNVIDAFPVAGNRNRVADALTVLAHLVVAAADRPADILLDRATDEVGGALRLAAADTAAGHEIFFAAAFASTPILRAATVQAGDVTASATDSTVGA